MNNSGENDDMWLVEKSAYVIATLVVGCVLMLNVPGCDAKTTTDTSASGATSRTTAEHRYATERLKQEGYSTADAQQAADAIIKFHNAQKNR